ncbi:zinc finger, C2H2 type [Opisthorchis viverrini]|uniref:Uncharacterized protein n=2 Tax=Opisthorchis viverrini TaxID=6198 RepID=A0A074ZH35_OPIVI|nr:hypothetical protein T265_07450 [Opisthorchis viverrini]KER24997.1 hypothetical protein T265_07450 [Opisthorchis viverrini]OON20816.1 zinc finger, C2H2 type [Opisthorchis viverrini]
MPRGRKSQLYGLELRFICEWSGCSQPFSGLGELKTHVLEHFRKFNESAMHFAVDPYCGICGAALDLTDWGSLERHSHYHAWTLFLRVKGCQIQEINDWPPCLADNTSRTTVPDLPTPFECGWEYCDYRTNDITDFILHVSRHPEEYTDSRYPTDVQLKCLWENCQYVARCLKNLVSHLDSHSQGKRVACPTCGLLLSNFNKFEDHLKRQQIHLLNKADEEETTAELHHSVKPMRCNRCRRIFPTEKLLIAHMQRHVNTVKCPFCDMTVFGKTALDRHILFRHTTEKPFACDQCEYRCKTLTALNRHVQIRHQSKRPQTDKTEFSSRTFIPDTDLDNCEPTVAPVLGPLAAAGALSILNPTQSNLLSKPAAIQMKPHNPNHSLCPSPLPRTGWMRCTQPGCRFRTLKRTGFMIHISRRHPDLLNEFNASLTKNYDPASTGALYACHLCSVIKRRGFDLSRHLMRDHNLARPSGHMRFTYAVSDDGYYRLQLTRLDTVPVAAALLGETVVNKLLSTSATS